MAPEPDCFQIEKPENLADSDDVVIKLSAQFVAFNGQQFLEELTSKKKKGGQFEFLNPTHTLFGYFSGLVEQYSKLLEGIEPKTRDEILKQG